MKKFLFYITLFILIAAFSTTASHFDNDLWARLIAGMGVIEGGHVLTQDFLSYTPVHTWWDHEWGAGVIFYVFLKYFGSYSLIILQALLVFAIFFTASKVIKHRYNNPYNLLFYFFSIVTLMPMINTPIRCHLFSFLLFTVFIYILEKVRSGNDKLLFIIPAIVPIWNNIHGGIVSGIGLLLIYALGEFLNKKPFKKYIITFLACCPLLFINPWGYDYIKFILMANTMPRPDITEWWNIFSKYHLAHYMGFKFFMLILITFEVCINIKQKNWAKIDKTKYIIILVTLYLAISHVKLMPFFTISALCFIYEDFYELIKNIKIPAYKDKLVYGFILFLSLFTFLSKDFSVPSGIDIYPVKEVEFIKQNKLEGKIFANFNYGSYIAYKLYPYNTIYMDGRYEEVYYDYMLPLQKQFFLVLPQWQLVLKLFKPDIMIIEKNYPVFEVLNKSKEWKLVYEGKGFGIFLPSIKANKNFIQPDNSEKYYKNNLFDTDIKF